jgi:hypothetical protein
MSDTVRDTFVSGIKPDDAPIVLQLDRTIVAARPELNTRISYGMLTYVLGRDARHWICAIGVTKKAVCLRFLFGAWLHDPQGHLRAGSSHLSTLDYRAVEGIDAEYIADLVTEACDRLDEFKARQSEA